MTAASSSLNPNQFISLKTIKSEIKFKTKKFDEIKWNEYLEKTKWSTYLKELRLKLY